MDTMKILTLYFLSTSYFLHLTPSQFMSMGQEKSISIQERTEDFAVRVIRAYCELNRRPFDDAGKVLAKQFLRSGTSIGANCSEAKYAQSTNDFISKYSIALKEANETLYWISILIKSGLVSQQQFQRLIEENERIIKILVASLNTLKNKQK